jgi:hypothetical protein
MVQVRSHSWVCGFCQPSQRPAKTIGEPSFISIEYGIFPPITFFQLIETVCRDQAPPFFESAMKRMSDVNRLPAH